MNTQQRIETELIALNVSNIFIDALTYYTGEGFGWNVKVATAVGNQNVENANLILAALLSKGYEGPALEWVTTTRTSR